MTIDVEVKHDGAVLAVITGDVIGLCFPGNASRMTSLKVSCPQLVLVVQTSSELAHI